MSKIKWENIGGPYGDACSSYEGTILETLSIYDFLMTELKPKEWGTVYYSGAIANYQNGTITLLVPEDSSILKKQLIIGSRVLAHGGWSMMDYQL